MQLVKKKKTMANNVPQPRTVQATTDWDGAVAGTKETNALPSVPLIITEKKF